LIGKDDVVKPEQGVRSLHEELASLTIDRTDAPPLGRFGLSRKLVVGAVLVALVVGGMAAGSLLKGEAFKAEVEATSVTLVSPSQEALTVTATGYVVARVVARPGAKVLGRLTKVLVKEGDEVKAGQVLAEQESADERRQLASAEARVEVAHARAEVSRASLAEFSQQVERMSKLETAGVSSRAEIEDMGARKRVLEETVKAAEAERRAAQVEVDNLRLLLRDRTILAPISGTIISKPPEAGELLGPLGQQTALVEIIDRRSLVVETDVPESRISLIHPGSPCEVAMDAYPSKRYRCAVAELGQRVNRAKATIPVRVSLTHPPEEYILPDMAGRVNFLERESPAAGAQPKHVVPASAVVEREGAKVVFVIEQGRARMERVILGVPMANGFELVSGPSPGTMLVDKPARGLVDGQPVESKERS
jgi:HlyD family secretion protein